MTDRAAFPVGASIRLDDLAGPDAHHVLARLRAAEPVSWVPDLGAWLVTGRAEVVAALRDPAGFTVDDPRFSTGRVLGPSMLSTDGDQHRRHRTPFLAPFRGSLVDQRDRPAIEELAADLVAGFRDRGRAELRTELAGPLATTTIVRALGLDVEPDVAGAWYRSIVDGVDALSAAQAAPPETGRAVADLGDAVGRAAAADRGVVAELATAADLTDAELASNVGVVLFGAIETAEGMTANALAHLLADPTLVERAAADHDVIPAVIEESLRLEPAAAVVDRYATRPVRSLGPTAVEIGTGDPVSLSLAAANRDPAVVTDPDRFDPDRSDRPGHLAFAAGPHACLGAHLARVETGVAIAAVLDGLDRPAIDHRASTPATGLVFRKPKRVVATWSPRTGSPDS